MELDGHFQYLFAGAMMGEPSVRQVGADHYKLYILDLIDVVADDALGARRIQDQVQLHFLVVVKREIERAFFPGEDGETIVLRERGDFPQQIFKHNVRFRCQ